MSPLPQAEILQRIKNCQVNPGGPLQDAFTLLPQTAVPAGTGRDVNWYFANLGLLSVVEEPTMADPIGRYIQLYLSRITPGLRIEDLELDANGNVLSTRLPDSDDSYVATLLSLVSRYCRATGKAAWFAQVWPTLRKLTEANTISNRYTNPQAAGLTSAFQYWAAWDVGYLEDNCEVYRGLTDLADYLDFLNQTIHPAPYTADAARYRGCAAQTLSGITRLYNNALPGIWVAGATSTGFDTPQGKAKWDPDYTCQLASVIYKLPIAASAETAGYNYLNSYRPGWTSATNDPDGYPQLHLGYGAALLGHKTEALKQLSNSDTHTAPDHLTINELGWYLLTLKAAAP